MMSQFFIRRPVFAWVIAIFIILFGLLSIPKLPIARFPSVAPPQVNISATYPGATAKTINDSVVTLIERELSGVKIYCITVRQRILRVQQKFLQPLNRVQMSKWLRSMSRIKSRLLKHAYHRLCGSKVYRLKHHLRVS